MKKKKFKNINIDTGNNYKLNYSCSMQSPKLILINSRYIKDKYVFENLLYTKLMSNFSTPLNFQLRRELRGELNKELNE